MSKNRVLGISKRVVYPVNNRTSFAFKNGNSQLEFEISPMDQALLDTKSLRLNFMFRVLDDTTTVNAQTPIRVNNQGTNGQTEKTCLMDSRVGINSIIDVLRAKNFNSESIFEVRNYSRLLASSNPVLNSFGAYKTYTAQKNLAFAKESTTGLAINGDNFMSIPLRSGLFNSGSPLNTLDMNGLRISCLLAPDSYVLYSAGANSHASNCHYELSDVSLSYNTINLENRLMPGQEMYRFPSYQSYTSIIAASDDTQSLMLSLESVRAIFSNFVKTSHINNFSRNSLETNKLQDANAEDKDIKQLVYTRNNIKMPKLYSIDENEAVKSDCYDAFRGSQFLDAFRPFQSYTSTLQSAVTEGFKSPEPGQDQPDVKSVYGIASNQDLLFTGAGVSYDNSQFAVRINSQLEDGTPNTSFTFALHNSGLAVKKSNIESLE